MRKLTKTIYLALFNIRLLLLAAVTYIFANISKTAYFILANAARKLLLQEQTLFITELNHNLRRIFIANFYFT